MKTNQQQQRHKKMIIDSQNWILKSKLRLLEEWAVLFFPVQHRCLMNVICARVMEKKPITYTELEEYKNGLIIVNDLKEGMLIEIIQKKIEKQSKKEVKFNPTFFKHLPQFLKRIKQKITPQIQNAKNFNAAIKMYTCANCKIQKTQEQLKFMGRKCEQCGQTIFNRVIEDRPKKERLQKLQASLIHFTKKKEDIEKEQARLDRIQKQTVDNEEKKMTELQKLKRQFKKAPQNQKPIILRYQDLQQAEKKYAPMRKYVKIEEMESFSERLHQQQTMILKKTLGQREQTHKKASLNSEQSNK